MSAAGTLRRAKRRVSRLLDTQPWRPGRAKLLLDSRSPKRVAPEDQDLRVHLLAAVDWLEHSHKVSRDGGFPGRYRLRGGWTASYPETTGYTVPTLLRLAEALLRSHLVDRAERCVDFLLSQQTDEGGFPGGEVGSGADVSVFNTSQILAGLDAWDEAHDAPRVLDAAARAAEWLIRVQHDDGAWRDFTYGGLACAYYAHASCWLARFGARIDEPRYTEAAARHVGWVLGRQDPETGWFAGFGFPRDHGARIAETHTLGYTLWGLLVSAGALGLDEAEAAARRAAHRLAEQCQRAGWLAGRYDHAWRPRATYACLTGNAQLTQVWQRLAADEDPGRRFEQAADRSLRLVLQAQSLGSPEAGIRGGVPGSTPLGGDYLPNALPGWSVKFLTDAILDRLAG